ncbi:MAG: serine/threonine protein kinase [Vicinamibacterales bacterium]
MAATPDPLDDALDEATVLVDPRAQVDAAPTLIVTDGDASATVILDPSGPASSGDEDRAPTIRMTEPGAVLPFPSAPGRTGVEAVEATPGASPERGAVRYVVVGVAGRGGMGTVHVARDLDLLRRVALKELSPDVAADRGARSRFVREVQVTAQLDHPHIVPVYSLEVAPGGRPAYAMKLVEGRTFAQLVGDTRAAYEAGRAPDEDHSLAVRLEHFVKVCDALEYAHERQVVHRDLKPANLMLGRHNEVYVMDWGICRVLSNGDGDAASTLTPLGGLDGGETAFGSIVGTPAYMSPEQAQGHHASLGPASDQCALGLILQELVTLDRPYSGSTLIDVLQQATTANRRPIAHAFGDDVPRELAAIITRATAREPERRYPSVAALAQDVRRYMRGEAVDASPDSWWETLVRRLARHRQTVALAVLGFAMVAMAAIGALMWRQDRAIRAQAQQDRRIEALVSDVSLLGDLLQTRLLQLDGELTGMTAAASQALQFGMPSTRPVPWASGPTDPGPATNIDAGDMIFAWAPGQASARVASPAARLLSVTGSQAHMLELVGRLLGEPGSNGVNSGLRELRAGFESGLKFVRPAAALTRTVPDVRQAAWYRAVREEGGTRWTALPPDDRGRDVAVAAPVRSADGAFLGAIGLVVSLERVLANIFAERRALGADGDLLDLAREVALVSADGNALATYFPKPATAGPSLLAVSAVREAADRGERGHVATVVDGRPAILAFDRIEPVGWTLALIVDEATLLASRSPAVP